MNYMQSAIDEAKNSKNDIPVGAVIVKDDKIIAKAHNLREELQDVTAHAEIIAIREAEKILGNWRLSECDMYVTLEPCPMCGWAILQSRMKNLYYGSYDNDYGAFTSDINLKKLTNNTTRIYGGIMEDECNKLLKNYFNNLRQAKD